MKLELIFYNFFSEYQSENENAYYTTDYVGTEVVDAAVSASEDMGLQYFCQGAVRDGYQERNYLKLNAITFIARAIFFPIAKNHKEGEDPEHQQMYQFVGT